MKHQRKFASWPGAILGSVCALLAFALSAHASDRHGEFSEEFHQTYSIAGNGRLNLENINGSVHISAWPNDTQDQVKVDAIKYANSKERLDEAHIDIDSGKDYLSIRTRYPDHKLSFNRDSDIGPASVEYTLTVPRTIRLDQIKLVNGSLELNGIAGEVRATCINGKLQADGLSGRAELSTINGHLDAHFDQLPGTSIELKSVNGSVNLTIPSDSKAEVEATTVSGGIENDFGLRVNHHRMIGHELRGELGEGGTRIKLENVNGHIEIRHASDGRTLSPVKDLGHHDHQNDDDDSI